MYVLPWPLANDAEMNQMKSAVPSGRVLVVEDHEDAREMMLLALEAIGYSARGAADAETALDIVADYRPHVILIDLGLPGMSGCELARILRERRGELPAVLVACTGHLRGGAVSAPLDPFDRGIGKPVQIEELARLLKDVLPALVNP